MNSATSFQFAAVFAGGSALDKMLGPMETRLVSRSHAGPAVLFMWPFRPSFKRKFARIRGGWSSVQVRQLLGEPTVAEDTAVPLGSTWGLQSKLTFNLRGGDPVREWMYERKGLFHYIWFARVVQDDPDPWRVTLTNKTHRKL